MARGWHPTWQDNNNGSGPNSGPPRRKRSFSGGYIFVLGLAVVVVLFMAAVGVIAAQTPSSRATAPDNSPTPAESPVPVKAMVEAAMKNPKKVVINADKAALAALEKKFKPFHDAWIRENRDGQKKYDALRRILAELRKGS